MMSDEALEYLKEEFINELGKYNVSVFGETLEELEQALHD